MLCCAALRCAGLEWDGDKRWGIRWGAVFRMRGREWDLEYCFWGEDERPEMLVCWYVYLVQESKAGGME